MFSRGDIRLFSDFIRLFPDFICIISSFIRILNLNLLKYLLFTIQKGQPQSGCPTFAWQRPTLTGTCVPTTIGAEKLNFRVRYGNGCDLLAIATKLFELRF